MTDVIDTVLKERGQRYGDFTTHADISITLKDMIDHFLFDQKKTLKPFQREALYMICHKIGRILNGDPDYADSWDDIAGYAKLAADRVRE